jgi:hypothetical protein
VASSFETLVFEIIAKDTQASAAFDRFRNKVDQTSASVDKNSKTVDKGASTWNTFAKTAGANVLPALIGVGAAMLPITAGAAAAGVGFTAFAGMALPSVLSIQKAMTGPGGLAAAWGSLDNRQRVAVQGVQALGDRYTGLAHAMEPQVFQVFNTTLGLANSLLGPTAKLATAAGWGIETFLLQFKASSGIQQFISFLAKIAGPAFAMLGTDVTNISHAVFALLESFGGMGLLELKALTGVITALTGSITWLSEHAPALTSVGLAIGGIAFALSKIGALSAVLKLTGIASIATAMTGFAAATAGASLAEKGLLASTAALDAVTPVGWAVLATAALGGLVLWLSRMKTVTDSTVTSLNAQNHATGFNTEGYLKAAASLNEYNMTQQQAVIQTTNLHTGAAGAAIVLGDLTGATDKLTAATQKDLQAFHNQDDFLGILQQKYGLTRLQAISLAEKSGVLASQVNKGGAALKDSVTRAEAYANANLAAQKPTSQLASDMQDFANKTLTATQRTTALTNALKLFFDPAVTADQDLITLAGDAQTLAAALKASGGETAGLTGKQGAARSAFDTYISQVAQTAQDTFNATGKTSDYSRIINNALPGLERAAGDNKALRREIQDLINTEKAMRSENVNINVTGAGRWNVVGPGGPGHRVGATGMLVSGGVPGQDSVPILAMPGEVLVPVPMVQSGAVDHLRGRIPGFAQGGVVGSHTGHSIPGLDKWVNSENTATINAMASSVASALINGAAAAATGGGGAGVARWAPDILRALAMLGQSSANLGAVEHRMNQESGGNPRAINLTDINAQMGDPSRGLMQTIGSTFEHYRSFLFPDDIYNPMANIYAGLNYALNAYPGRSLSSVMMQPGGYDEGGYLPPGLSLAYNGTGSPEPVGKSAGGNNYTINVHVAPGGNLAEAGRVTVNAIREFEKRSGKGWRS